MNLTRHVDIRHPGAMVFRGIHQPWPDCQALKLIRPWSEPRMSEAWSGRIEIEGVVQRSGGRRIWSGLGKDGLVAFAKWEIAAKGISSRKELSEADSRLYNALRTRGALDKVGLESKRRDWEAMSDEKLIAYAKALMKGKGLSFRVELENEDSGLYAALLKREKDCPGFMQGVGFTTRLRHWARMSDEELIAHAKGFVEEKGISGKMELNDSDPGLYSALYKREMEIPGIMRLVGLADNVRHWKGISDHELVAHAKALMKEKGISCRSELEKADASFYATLKGREKKNPGIMGEIAFSEIRVYWGRMADEEIITRAKTFIKERGITGKVGLRKAYAGLYSALISRERKRPGIMERVFSVIKSSTHADAVNGVLEALESFGDGK